VIILNEKLIEEISNSNLFSEAVLFFWNTRDFQSLQQQARGGADQGSRSSVTGGKQMDGFIELISRLLQRVGTPRSDIYINSKLELPGYYRSEKKWDLLVIKRRNNQKELVAVIELKSQIGPSFGNNFNNRTEEAMGSAHDLWTAFREGAYLNSSTPWLGYLFLLEDCERSRSPVKVSEPHFKVFPEFKNASYNDRYREFCLRLVRERLYTASCFLTASMDIKNCTKNYNEPHDLLSANRFLISLLAHVNGHYNMQ